MQGWPRGPGDATVSDRKVTVSHDGVVYTRPPRGGPERIVFVPLETEARLRSISRSEMAEGPCLKASTNGRIHTRIFEGRLWRQVAHPDRRRDEGSALSEAKFVRWLSNRPAGAENAAIDWCFSSSPMMAYSRWRFPPTRMPKGVEGGSVGRPILDMRDEGREAVARFIEKDVLIVDGVPMVRFAGPLVARQVTSTRRQLDIVRHPGGGHMNHSTLHPPYFRMDRAETMPEALRRVFGPGQEAEYDLSWHPDDLEGYGYEGDEDINLSLRHALRHEFVFDRNLVLDDGKRSTRPIREMVARSVANLTIDADLPRMADLLEEVIALRRATYKTERPRDTMQGYIEEWARPILALRTAPIPEGDLDAIAGMGIA